MGETDIAIRGARDEELDAIEELVREAYAEYVPQLPPDIWKLWSDSIHETINSGEGEIIVAEIGGEVVGLVHFFPDVSPLTLIAWPEGATSMRVLSVRPNARGRGVGRALVEECIRRARTMGSPGLYILTTGHMEHALRMYRSMGFVNYDDFDDSPFTPEERIEAYWIKP